MGQDPYVPRVVIESGRYRPTGRVRVVDYPDPYPIRATKIVTVEELDSRATSNHSRATSNPSAAPVSESV